MGGDRPARAAIACFRVGDLRRRRHDARTHPRHGGADPPQTGLRPAAHLTCVGAARGEIDEVVRGYLAAGVGHIVALRGDPPAGADAPYQPIALMPADQFGGAR